MQHLASMNWLLFIFQDGICDRQTAPSVSSISRVLRAKGGRDEGDLEDKDLDIEVRDTEVTKEVEKHSIDDILAEDKDIDLEEDGE